MSVTAYALNNAGTAISWKSSGGTYALTLTSLANAAARQGAKGDLGASWAQRYSVLLTASVAVAAANGTAVELYWATSPTATAGTDNPGAATGTDAAFGTPVEYKLQLIYIGSLALSNNAGTGIQRQVFEFFPSCRYGMPIVVNSSGQALGATATDHEVRLTPTVAVAATSITG
jgi:hypothetical protein